MSDAWEFDYYENSEWGRLLPDGTWIALDEWCIEDNPSFAIPESVLKAILIEKQLMELMLKGLLK